MTRIPIMKLDKFSLTPGLSGDSLVFLLRSTIKGDRFKKVKR